MTRAIGFVPRGTICSDVPRGTFSAGVRSELVQSKIPGFRITTGYGDVFCGGSWRARSGRDPNYARRCREKFAKRVHQLCSRADRLQCDALHRLDIFRDVFNPIAMHLYAAQLQCRRDVTQKRAPLGARLDQMRALQISRHRDGNSRAAISRSNIRERARELQFRRNPRGLHNNAARELRALQRCEVDLLIPALEFFEIQRQLVLCGFRNSETDTGELGLEDLTQTFAFPCGREELKSTPA